MKSTLLGITYSEFDNTVGPKLLYMYPLDVMSKERFEELSDYVIVGKHLCKKIIVIKNDDIQYMNFSVAIDNSKYYRNSLLFSLGFIIAEGIDTEPFEPILRKLSLAFLALENESEFLFLESTKPQIQNVLRNLFEDLTEKGETFINLDESNILTAKIYRAPQEPIEIFEYNVPILRYDKISQINIPWDISLNYLLGRIDGISHIRKIASRKPIVDIECVKRCLRTLMFYDCVVISDVVQFTNVYQLQKNVQPLICDISILQRIQSFCCVKQQEPPDLGNIVRFLLKFRPGKQLSQVLVSAGVELLYGIDVRRLIAIAQDFNIISRLHEYPVYILRQEQEKSGTTSTPLQLQQTESSADIQRLLHSGSARLQPPTTARVTSKDLNPTSNINAIKTRNLLRRSVTSVEQSVLNASSEIGSTDLSYVLCSLKGSVCLDAVCCALEIAPSEILDSSKYYIVYK